MTTHYTQSPAEAKIAVVSELYSVDLAGFCSARESNRIPSASGVAAKSEEIVLLPT